MRHTPLYVLLLLLSHCAGSGRLHRLAAQLNSRGAAQLAASSLDDAEASLHLALEYNRRFAEPYNNLGLIALRRGRVAEARARFREATDRNGDFAEAWSNLGVALLRHAPGDNEAALRDEAIWALREALDNNPGLYEARVNLARALLERGEYAQAIAQARQLCQLREGEPLPWLLRAEAALRVGALTEADTASERAVELSQNTEERLMRARVQLAQGALTEALADLRALRGDTRYGSLARALIAVALIARDDRAGAARELEGLDEQGDAGPTVRLARQALTR